MAKLLFHPKGHITNKMKLRTQYKGLKNWIKISIGLNVCLIIILVLLTTSK